MIHILVVEDDRELNQAVCKHLSAHGYFPLGCGNPGEAYDRLYAETYDIIISDIISVQSTPGVGSLFTVRIRIS